MPVMCVVVDGEKIAGSIEKVVDADDGYARSSSSGPNDEQESNFDDESDGLSSSSSGVGSSALDSGPNDIVVGPKFNPETRAVLVVESTRSRNIADYFRLPIGCSLCNKQFETIDLLNAHKDTLYHVVLEKIAKVQIDVRRVCITKMPHIQVTAQYTSACDIVRTRIALIIENRSFNDAIQIEHLFWIDKSDNDRLMLFNDLITFPWTIDAQNGRKFWVEINRFIVTKHYELIIHLEYQREKFVTICNFRVTNKPIITMRMKPLPHYFPAASVRSLQKSNYELVGDKVFSEEEKSLHQTLTEYKNADKRSRLTSDNYHSMLKLMLQMEDEIASTKCLSYDQENQVVNCVRDRIYSLKINNKTVDEAVAEYARLWITPMSMRLMGVARNEAIQKILDKNPNADVKLWRTQRVYGSIVKVEDGLVHIELDKYLDVFTKKTGIAPDAESYFIRFLSNRTTIALEHRALDLVDEHKISRFFFPDGNVAATESMKSINGGANIEWMSDLNDEQRAAVVNILHQSSYPFPYILFGPPGTGKTKTLVEAIAQIIKRNEAGEHVLVSASSNSACDEIASRLLQFASNEQIYRMFSATQIERMGIISANVLAASNLCKAEHFYPSLVKLYQYKVVICTLTTAGRLSQAHIKPNHFTHVFIDESGSATETQSLIAIAGVCTSTNKIHASITFAGDPKQLGPIIKSHAIKLGYGVSMLERLMDTPLYARDPKTKLFDAKYVTQLVRNYRSHETILRASNELFYDNVLQVHASKSNTDWFLNASILRAPEFPIIFHSVKGRAVKLPKETSLFNVTEIDLVISYLHKLFDGNVIERKIRQSDVGIISPYRKQCEKLTKKCHQLKWTDIQIGSVEIFQGQERPIIIVSTVRSGMRNIGFLDNAKRLNVLLTRAKCLMIIIGDSTVLGRDKNWTHVIKYCDNNGSLIKS